MGAFSAIEIARTGMGFAGSWVDTVAHNLANLNTVNPPGEEPFRARMLVARANGDEIASTGSGVHTAAVVESAAEPAVVYEPGHAHADEEGYVTRPVVELDGQLTDLMLAQRTYQANSKAVQAGKEAYEAALQIGQAR